MPGEPLTELARWLWITAVILMGVIALILIGFFWLVFIGGS